ncbi:MAG: cation:proton antiporter [Nanoarchaeota archaeon]|nr:cation:proton antiporter [Nanoarchaeota archaeon]
MTATTFLTHLSIILVIGLFMTLISKKLKISNVLLLLLAGILVGALQIEGVRLIEFPTEFLSSIAVLALVMIVFDSASRFKIKEFSVLSGEALKLAFVFLLVNVVILSLASFFLFRMQSPLIAFVFASLMSGTDPAAVLAMFSGSKNKVIELIEIESIVNTPMVVLLPFITLDIIKNFGATISARNLMTQLVPFLQQFVAGMGAGLLVGLIAFRLMKKGYSEKLSPLALITAALLTYILAENLGGNGVLAVTVMGLFFGNIYVKQKGRLFEFSGIFAHALEILVFIMVGLIVKIPYTVDFFIRSGILFVIYLCSRFIAVNLSFPKGFTMGEKLFMSLNVQKGIAVAVVAFSFAALSFEGISTILNLTLIFMLYSIILSTILAKFAELFLGKTAAK